MSVASDGHGYVARHTARSALARVARTDGPALFAELEESGLEVPRFVRREFEAFGRCGDLRHGFLHVGCLHCGHRVLVPFSCKSRGICPSCMGRRMAETSMLLVDHVLPTTPYRHVTFTFPGPLAVRLGYDRELLATIWRALGARVDQSLRHRVKRFHGRPSVAALHPGSLAVVQRFRFDL
ncbi:MAG: hypothetical protein B7733_24760, partial [Myxococcales bacterium FL481]